MSTKNKSRDQRWATLFQNDFLALSPGVFTTEIDYTDISQREQLAAAIKDGHSAEFAQPHSLRAMMAILGLQGVRGGVGTHISHRSTRTGVTNLRGKCHGD